MAALLRATRCAALRAPQLAAPAAALQMAPAIAASPVLRLSRNMGAGAGSGGADLDIDYVKSSWDTVVTNVKKLTENPAASNQEIFERAGQVLFEKILGPPEDTATFEARCKMFTFKTDYDERIKDPHYKKHVSGVVETVNTAIDNLHDLAGLEKVLFDLGKRHNNYGVKNSHYTLVRDSLVYTLGVALGAPLSGKDAEQWTLVWGFVESNMKKGQASDASYSLEG